jgi:pyrroloquinoline quinone (PQQ) biosynthesis protein C
LTLDVRFDPTPAQEQALAYWRGILANKEREAYASVLVAEEAIESIQAEIDQPAKDYYASDTVGRMVYLRSHPLYAAQAAHIESCCKLYRELADNEKRKYTPFKALQFQRVEDMTVLRELRDFLMNEVGAVNDYHVETWRHTAYG